MFIHRINILILQLLEKFIVSLKTTKRLKMVHNDNDKDQTKKIKGVILKDKKEGCRHMDFPSGPPPQYQPCLKPLNFGVRMGSGAFGLVWTTAKTKHQKHDYAVPPPQKTCLCIILFQTLSYHHKMISIINLIISHQICPTFHSKLSLFLPIYRSTFAQAFIPLLILMKGGTSQYSRPTTAKKGVPSPKILKKPEQRTKVKTQQNDIDADKLYELIQQAIARQKDCQSRGKYVQAQGFKRKVKMLKEQLEDREMDEIRMRHEDELRQLQQAHLAEMNLFNLQWQKQINDFNNQIDRMLGELAQKHDKQMKDAENDLDVQRKFHQSPKLLELRRVEQELGRQENYMQAHKIQLKANKLEKEEMEKHKSVNNQKSKINLNQLKSKQENQAQASKMRIRLQVEQRQRNRLNEQAKLRQKYENILKETEFQQNQQLIRLNKAVKLNQLQKKSKVGMFSYSKEGLS